MIETITIIVLSVSVFGILFFLYIKRKLKKQLDYYLSKNKKNIDKIILQNLLNSSLGISKTFLDIS